MDVERGRARSLQPGSAGDTPRKTRAIMSLSPPSGLNQPTRRQQAKPKAPAVGHFRAGLSPPRARP